MIISMDIFIEKHQQNKFNLRFMRHLFILILSLIPYSGHAFDLLIDGIAYDIKSGRDVEVTVAPDGYTGEVIIPTMIEEIVDDGINDPYPYIYNVVGIGDSAFKGSSIKSIYIPATIDYIGVDAFLNCSGLVDLIIADGAYDLSISYDEFQNPFHSCPLIHVYLGRNIAGMDYGSMKPVYSQPTLQYLEIGPFVNKIPDFSFDYLMDFESLVIYDSDTPIYMGYGGRMFSHHSLFYDCPLKEVYIGRNIQCSDDYPTPFQYHPYLTEITFGDDVTVICSKLFYLCQKLESIDFGNSITEIQSQAFDGCRLLSDIDLPSSLTVLGHRAFNNTAIRDVSLPDGLIKIDDACFANCDRLEKVFIGKNIQSIERWAFANTNISEVSCYNPEPCYLGYEAFEGVYSTARLKVPETSIESYYSAAEWSNFKNISGIDSNSISDVRMDDFFIDSHTLKSEYDIILYSLSGELISSFHSNILPDMHGQSMIIKIGHMTLKIIL